MRIESNIKSVIAQVEALRAKVPVAAQAALEPQHWLEPAKQLAERILLSLATPQERSLIPKFVENITLLFQGGELSFGIKAPPSGEESDGGNTLNEQSIFEWVQAGGALGKKKDKRDAGKNDADIAQFLTYLMLNPKIKPGSEREAARERLRPHIEAFLATRQAQLPPETVDLWLRSVLSGWRELVKLNYPVVIRRQLREPI